VRDESIVREFMVDSAEGFDVFMAVVCSETVDVVENFGWSVAVWVGAFVVCFLNGGFSFPGRNVTGGNVF